MIGLAIAWSTAAIAGAGGLAPDASEPVVVQVQRETTNVVVQVRGCDALDPAEVARVLDLELQSVTTEIRSGPPLAVALACEDQMLAITIVDPLTHKELRREVPAPPREPGRERIVALAISELFSASWLELLTTAPASDEPVDTGTPPPVPAPAVRAAIEIAERRTRARRGIELLAGAGARGRSLQAAPFAGLRVDALAIGWLSQAVGLVGTIGWDFGQADRRLGQVRGHAIGAGAGLAWRVRPRPVVGVGGNLTMSAAWVRLSGIAAAPDVPRGRTQGATAEVAAAIGPRVSYGRLRVHLDAELGYMLRAPQGIVTSETNVSMGGVWVGAALRLGADVAPSGP